MAESPPLDRNSRYCNLLQCSHFAETSILVEGDDGPVGWISAYLIPNEPHTLFIWQVAVSRAARGQKLGKRMIQNLVSRPALTDVTHIKTTITRDNAASWGLFNSVASELGAELTSAPHFDAQAHFDGVHETEHMVTIGPF
ncbi:MAG: diaminobutyrate acetyltransferase [Parvibaculaceae bacterium]|nr:diaminobutyrate acetyltransferase [Parvibaculaceae bacterium]